MVLRMDFVWWTTALSYKYSRRTQGRGRKPPAFLISLLLPTPAPLYSGPAMSTEPSQTFLMFLLWLRPSSPHSDSHHAATCSTLPRDGHLGRSLTDVRGAHLESSGGCLWTALGPHDLLFLTTQRSSISTMEARPMEAHRLLSEIRLKFIAGTIFIFSQSSRITRPKAVRKQ